MEENINALDEVNKAAEMGLNAINLIAKKVNSKNFKQVLKIEAEKYQKIIETIKQIYPKYNSESSPHQINSMEKIMTWWGIELNLIGSNSISKIAELIVKGTNMGIIEGQRILNNKKLNGTTTKILNQFIKMQKDSEETLKKFL